jgi:methylated-DNA-[protein]-cysteine S-methyltransferase
VVDVRYDVFDTPVGRCLAAVRGGRLAELHVGKIPALKGARRDAELLRPVRRAVAAWFAGRAFPALRVDLDWATPFEREVYRVVREIPRGRVLSYGEVARRAGRPGAARAVGQAMGKNRLCLAIP